MTSEERDICNQAGGGIMSAKLAAMAAEIYGGENIQEIIVGDFTLPELFDTLKRAVKQLLRELKESWRILPNQLYDAHPNLTDPEGSLVLLTKQIAYINSAIQEKDLESWIPELLFIIRYEMHYGFWDRSKVRIHNPSELNIAKSQNAAEILLETANQAIIDSADLQNNIRNKLNEVEDFFLQKQQQFSGLDKNLEQVTASLTEIRNAEKEASTSNGIIGSLLTQTDKTLDESRKKIQQDRKHFNEIKEQVSLIADESAQRINTLGAQSQIFDDIIREADEKKQHILDQETEIMRLIGHAADGRLATAFNERERAISNRVDWWRNTSIAVVLLAISWAALVFYYYNPTKSESGINWLIFLANVIRSSPAFLLVFFCQAQYTKERNLQEEYAYKAAVSRTVTSYADMIGTGEMNERVKMLIETIQRIYAPPTLDKPVKPVSIKSKHLAQAAKSMADTAKDLKSTIIETAKDITSNNILKRD